MFGVQILPFAGFNSSNKNIFPDSYKMNAVTNVNVTKLCWTTRDAAKFNKKILNSNTQINIRKLLKS